MRDRIPSHVLSSLLLLLALSLVLPLVHSISASNRANVRIRTTLPADVPIVASFLSERESKDDSLVYWKRIRHQMAKLFDTNDIAILLEGRRDVLQEGKRTFAQLFGRNNENTHVWSYWWNTSDRFRSKLAKAAGSTGETNVWRGHNFALTPPVEWLQHLQMTAIDAEREETVVGFCEIAMLENPLVDDDKDELAFQLAITNLGTAPSHRRRGIAQRLLQRGERYVRMYWPETEQLGLFVEQSNSAALALYEKLGYRKVKACPGGDRLGDMWYMVKGLSRYRKQKLIAGTDNGSESLVQAEVFLAENGRGD